MVFVVSRVWLYLLVVLSCSIRRHRLEAAPAAYPAAVVV
jgi:hypothetical protein